MSDELTIHDQVDAFADGELAPAEAETFRAHLGGCADCQRELREIMMLAAVTQTHAQALTGTAPTATAPATSEPRAEKLPPVISLASRRRRIVIATVSTMAAAAAVVVLWRAARPEPIVLAQADRRPIEARVSYATADRYRPYDVARAAATAREEIPIDTLARLEKRGELRGLADGYLLGGEPDRAAELLARAGESAEVESDRAAVALAQHDAAAALAHATRALALRADYAPALWNEALALRDLGLPNEAMLAFERIAKRGEAGWSDEARERAAALRKQLADLERTRREVEAAGQAMIATGATPPAALLRAYPGLIHRDLYAALRAAGNDRARIKALVPVAAALDAIEGGTLASHLAALAAGKSDSARDPWLDSVDDETGARARLSAGDAAGAERLLIDADRRCLAARLDYRCALLEYALVEAQQKLGNTDEKVALAGLQRARAAGFPPKDLPARFLHVLAQLATARGDTPLATAYDGEWLSLP